MYFQEHMQLIFLNTELRFYELFNQVLTSDWYFE